MQDRFKFRYVFSKDFGGKTGICYKMPIFNLDTITNENFNKVIKEYTDYDYKLVSKCQCTGLKDKHGKFIFEGDIVKVQCNREDKGGLFYKTGIIAYELNEKNDHGHADSSFYLKLNNGMCALFSKEKCEVIGNIYDNPELLEEVE